MSKALAQSPLHTAASAHSTCTPRRHSARAAAAATALPRSAVVVDGARILARRSGPGAASGSRCASLSLGSWEVVRLLDFRFSSEEQQMAAALGIAPRPDAFRVRWQGAHPPTWETVQALGGYHDQMVHAFMSRHAPDIRKQQAEMAQQATASLAAGTHAAAHAATAAAPVRAPPLLSSARSSRKRRGSRTGEERRSRRSLAEQSCTQQLALPSAAHREHVVPATLTSAAAATAATAAPDSVSSTGAESAAAADRSSRPPVRALSRQATMPLSRVCSAPAVAYGN